MWKELSAMAQERTNFSAERRGWLQELKDKKLLDFNEIDNKEIFFMMMALGCDKTPKELKKAESWIQCNVYSIKEKTLICAVLLGKLCMKHEDINEQANFMKCNRYAEKCAEAGFDVLDEMVKEANYNNDELCAAFLNELDRLYNVNVRAADL